MKINQNSIYPYPPPPFTLKIYEITSKKYYLSRIFLIIPRGPTMLLGATRAPLNYCFILKIFLEYF